MVSLMSGTPTMNYAWGAMPLAVAPEFFSNLHWLHAQENGGTRVEESLPIPANSSLVGYEAGFCWLVFDPGSTDPDPIYNSESMHIRIGG